MAKPKVTVIIPVYNAGEHLEECLTSVFKQTFDKGVQLICVDDGSIDRSFEILKKYEDKMTLLQMNNGGASSARNKGFELAEGTFTIFLDADDSIPEDYLEILYKEAKENKADIVVTGFNYRRGQACVPFKSPLPIGNYTKFSDKLGSLYNGALWNKLFRTSLIKKNKLSFEEGRMWEDNLFVIQALYYSKIFRVIYEPCYNYCVNSNSVTNSRDLRQKRIDDAQFIYTKTMKFVNESKLSEEDKASVDTFLRKKAMPNYVLN